MSQLVIAAGRILTPLEILRNGVIVIEEGIISRIGTREEVAVPRGARFVDVGERVVAPGFIDLHIHGAAGRDLMEGTAEAVESVAEMLIRHGTTSFVPTTLTAGREAFLDSIAGLSSVIECWSRIREGEPKPCAEPLGIHLEGPFLSSFCRGAHPREDLQKPSRSFFAKCLEAGRDRIRIITLAPELSGASEVQSQAIEAGVKVAIGHSNASYEEAEKAIADGASHATHVFNTMRPFTHRDPGILGAVLTDDRAAAEVIADGVHVSPPALRLLLRAKGTSGILLVTDGVSATGMPPGRYKLGEMDIFVEDDPRSGPPVCRNREGALAGSVLTQDRAVRNMANWTGITLQDAIRMATFNPARILGLEARKGCLRPGADADLIVLEADRTVAGAMVRGVGNFL